MDNIKADLEDLYREWWLRKRERGEIVWTTKEGKGIPINEMSDVHLENAIKMLTRLIETQDISEEHAIKIESRLG